MTSENRRVSWKYPNGEKYIWKNSVLLNKGLHCSFHFPVNITLYPSHSEFNSVLFIYFYCDIPINVSPAHVIKVGDDRAVYTLLMTLKLRVIGWSSKESALHTKEGCYKWGLLQHQLSSTLQEETERNNYRMGLFCYALSIKAEEDWISWKLEEFLVLFQYRSSSISENIFISYCYVYVWPHMKALLKKKKNGKESRYHVL